MENAGNLECGVKADQSVELSNKDIIKIEPNNSITSDENISRKLFIGNLKPEITKAEIKTYFSAYGDIKNIEMKNFPDSKKTRKFAFIVFKTAETVNIITAIKNHAINAEPIDVQIANKLENSEVFINLPNELEENDVETYFSQFGIIIKVETSCENQTNERKRHCVITYDSPEVVHHVVKNSVHTVNGKEVTVQKSPCMGSQVEKTSKQKSSKKQNADTPKIIQDVQSEGKLGIQQNKILRNHQNFNETNLTKSNMQRNNFERHSFNAKQKLGTAHNFNSRQNFDVEQNFDNIQHSMSQKRYGNKQHCNRENYVSGQNDGNEHNFSSEQRHAQFVHRQDSLGANNFNVCNLKNQKLSSQNASNQNYGNNRVYDGSNNSQQGYWSTFSATSSSTTENPNFSRRRNEHNFSSERRRAQFLHRQAYSDANKNDVGNLKTQKLSSQNASKQNKQNFISQKRYGNKHYNKENYVSGQNDGNEHNFSSEQRHAQFLHRQDFLGANNFNVCNLKTQKLSSQNASNQNYGNNRVYDGSNNSQRGYWNTFAATSSSTTENLNFSRRHTGRSKNNTDCSASRNIGRANRGHNKDYDTVFRSNKFHNNHASLDFSESENINTFGFSNNMQPKCKGTYSNMRFTNERNRRGREEYNETFNPNNRRKYHSY